MSSWSPFRGVSLSVVGSGGRLFALGLLKSTPPPSRLLMGVICRVSNSEPLLLYPRAPKETLFTQKGPPPFPQQFSSVAQACPTLCDPMDCSMPGFPVHHQFPELAQTHLPFFKQIQSNKILQYLSLLQTPSVLSPDRLGSFDFFFMPQRKSFGLFWVK